MSASGSRHYDVHELTEFAAEVFVRSGLSSEDAFVAGEVLSTADLWGIRSHGLARLGAYFDLLQSGNVNPRPNIQVVREGGTTARVDGDNGLGLVVGTKAIKLAIAKAERSGVGVISVYNSSHFGIAGFYASLAAERELIGCALTNTPALVSPAQGKGRKLGTNPIAVAFPSLDRRPMVIDLATSAISFGAVEMARRRSALLPTYSALDGDGALTTEPQSMQLGGSLLPLGGDAEHSGHKGYCLAAVVDILCGVLSGANWGPFVPPFLVEAQDLSGSKGAGLGHLFAATRIDCFMEPAEFKERLAEWTSFFRLSEPASGFEAVLAPGDPERAAEARNRSIGIEFHEAVCSELDRVAEATGLTTRWRRV